MAFTPIGTLNGEFSPVIVTMPTSSLTLPQGALVSKAAGSNTLAGFVHTMTGIGATGSVPLLGVTNAPVASTDLFTDVTLTPAGTRGLIDVMQIANGTTLTATGGSGTTFVMSTFKGLPDSTMIGAVIQTITCASGDAVKGQQMTITAFTQSSGTMTFASVGSTGFASGDTVKLIRLRPSNLELSNPTSLATAYNYNYVGGTKALWLDQTASTGFGQVDLVEDLTSPGKGYRWAYVIGTNGDGTKLDIVLTCGPETALFTT